MKFRSYCFVLIVIFFIPIFGAALSDPNSKLYQDFMDFDVNFVLSWFILLPLGVYIAHKTEKKNVSPLPQIVYVPTPVYPPSNPAASNTLNISPSMKAEESAQTVINHIFCVDCGSENPVSAQFCQNCGSIIK